MADGSTLRIGPIHHDAQFRSLECLLRVLVVWKRAAILVEAGVCTSSAFFGGCRLIFRISSVWAVLADFDAPEWRYEPEVARFLGEWAPHARIAAISGWMPMMFMTRVRL